MSELIISSLKIEQKLLENFEDNDAFNLWELPVIPYPNLFYEHHIYTSNLLWVAAMDWIFPKALSNIEFEIRIDPILLTPNKIRHYVCFIFNFTEGIIWSCL